MKLTWDYSHLAKTYNKRPNYNQSLINEVIKTAGLNEHSVVCDIGAGTGYLASQLAPHVRTIAAVEPNPNMRTVGISHCQRYTNIRWFKTTGEATGLPENSFDMITFGSSFNVVNQQQALIEAQRIVKSTGWFLALWNHRNLEAPLQQKIENYIKAIIPDYQYGNRRQDQTEVLKTSGYFKQIRQMERPMSVEQSVDDVIAAWESHATLKRQAQDRHQDIIGGISAIINSQYMATIKTPYTTRAWLAQFK